MEEVNSKDTTTVEETTEVSNLQEKSTEVEKIPQKNFVPVEEPKQEENKKEDSNFTTETLKKLIAETLKTQTIDENFNKIAPTLSDEEKSLFLDTKMSKEQILAYLAHVKSKKLKEPEKQSDLGVTPPTSLPPQSTPPVDQKLSQNDFLKLTPEERRAFALLKTKRG